MTDWRIKHGQIIASFLNYLNARSSRFILKGGTALHLCYKLDRFSEDIDLDGREKGLPALVNDFCQDSGYTYRLAKDTETVERCFMNYGNAGKPLKIEVSYRRKDIPNIEIKKINGILVYDIETICLMKCAAYAGRDKIRDLYDLTFICNNYFDRLSEPTRAVMRNTVEYKGIEQFDYVIRTQADGLIDNKKLSDDFLDMYERLGLLYAKGELKMLSETLSELDAENEQNEEDWGG